VSDSNALNHRPRHERQISRGLGPLHVLAVGINDYPAKAGFSKLHKCVNDAEQVATAFGEVHQLNAASVQLMTSKTTNTPPHRGVILDRLHDLANEAEENDRILFYFSGHGHRLTGVDDHFLVPQDVYSAEKAEALLSMKEVMGILDGSRAKQKLVLLDACLSGPGLLGTKLNAAGFSAKFFAEYLEKTKGIVILSSSTADEASYEHSPNPKLSLFTHFVVLALRGDPKALEQQILTVPTLYDFVSTAVVRESKSRRLSQTPSLAQTGNGTFVLADFRQLIVAPTAVDLSQHPIVNFTFRDRYQERTKLILTAWSGRSMPLDQLAYAANSPEALSAYLAERVGRWRTQLRKQFGFASTQIASDGGALTFPGGALTHRFEPDRKDAGTIERSLTLDLDWFDERSRLASLLDILNMEPQSVEFELASGIDPLAQVSAMEANGWETISESEEELTAKKGRVELTVSAESVSLSGIDIRAMLAATESSEQDQLIADVVSVVAPRKRLSNGT
jgi:hypothetical protein